MNLLGSLAEVGGQALLLLLFSLILVIVFFYVGAALRLVLVRDVPMPSGVGVSVGLGLAVGTAATALSIWFSNVPMAGFWLVIGGATVVWAVFLYRVARGQVTGAAILHRLGISSQSIRSDLILFLLAAFVFSPLLRHGATVWSYRTTDYSTHVGFTQVMLGSTPSGEPFGQVHPDLFGISVETVANYERPTTTAFLAIAQFLSGVTPLYLLGAVMVFLAFTATSAMAAAVHQLFALSRTVSVLAALIPMLSVVVITRLLDGQVAHALAISLMATLVAVIASVPGSSRRLGTIFLGALAGLLLSAALSANLVITLSLLPGLALLLLVAASSERVPWGVLVGFISAGTLTTGFLSVPFASRYLTTWMMNTGDTYGYPIALPSPLAIFGLQPDAQHGIPVHVIIGAWLLTLLFSPFVIKQWNVRSQTKVLTLAIPIYIMCVGGFLLLQDGDDSYKAHKYAAAVVAIFGPLFIGLIVRNATRFRRFAVPGMLLLSLVAVLLSARVVSSISVVIPRDLLALEGEQTLRNVSPLVVDLGNMYENEVAALVVPAPLVLIDPTVDALERYCSVDGARLVRREATAGLSTVEHLNETYALTPIACLSSPIPAS